jgi:hypothetical protein
MEKFSLRGTKPLLQFYALRLSLEAKGNLAKKYKNCARGKTQKPQMPGYTNTHLIYHILYLYQIVCLWVK